MSTTDTSIGITEAEAAFILRGLSNHVDANGVRALDWVLRRWRKEWPLLDGPAFLTHYVTQVGPTAYWNFHNASEPYPCGTDGGDARAASVIEGLLWESRAAPVLEAAKTEQAPSSPATRPPLDDEREAAAAYTGKATPAPKTDGQTPPAAVDKQVGRKEQTNAAIDDITVEVTRRKKSGEREATAGAEISYIQEWYPNVHGGAKAPSRRTLFYRQAEWFR